MNEYLHETEVLADGRVEVSVPLTNFTAGNAMDVVVLSRPESEVEDVWDNLLDDAIWR